MCTRTAPAARLRAPPADGELRVPSGPLRRQAARAPRAAARRARRHAADLVLCRARRERADAGARLQQAAARVHGDRRGAPARPPARRVRRRRRRAGGGGGRAARGARPAYSPPYTAPFAQGEAGGRADRADVPGVRARRLRLAAAAVDGRGAARKWAKRWPRRAVSLNFLPSNSSPS